MYREEELIEKIRRRFASRSIPLGIGDDAAVMDFPHGFSLVACSDLLAENTHFVRGLHPADSIGYRAVAVNVSDVGAMGGTPMYFLVSLAMPRELDTSWVDGFFGGVRTACDKFDVELVGGDAATATAIFVDVAMIARVRRDAVVRRSGSRPGDAIYVTGALGGSAHGLSMLRQGRLDDPSVLRHLYPEPRHRIGAAVAGKATAMIDVSDGLSTDLGHIIEESQVSARIYKDRLPAYPGTDDRSVLHGGEEYELIITAPGLPAVVDGLGLARIGEIIASSDGHTIFLVDGGAESVLKASGWQHFA